MERESFVFYRSFFESIRDLPRDIQGEVLTAIIEYGLYGETTENPKPIAGAILTLVKPQIDANNKRYNNGLKGAEHGIKGGRPKKENPTETPRKPQENPTETPNVNDNNKNIIKHTIHIDNNILFEQIKNLPEYLKNFQGNKLYLFVAYRFWELWKKENPTNLTVKNANVSKWYHEVRKIVEIDKTTIERLIGIYAYFKQIQKGEAGFRRFWFDTIKSIHGIRKKNKAGEYYLDRIITEVNEELERNEDFERLVVDLIQKTKDYASNKIPKKQI